ncbi:right-handed parallel beta-helix repeat-containing protein [Arthrobacter sp. NIO-1057]|uniref:right-handed parallel beta-helix repeat-containing protein n=1 Tax=Arthrobacter sp. NIO-1057 TaxID=993071 RepID=UPI00159F175A|nr:right-handed parallel beta-helix repeat-containing protein [Arthrobacter sp. NIO-1057]
MSSEDPLLNLSPKNHVPLGQDQSDQNSHRPRLIAALALAAACGIIATSLNPVPAVASTTLVADAMNRTIDSGWGTNSGGISYLANSPDRFSVDGSQGEITLVPGKLSLATAAINAANLQTGVDVSFDSLPDTGSSYAHLSARSTADGEYTASLRLQSTGTLTLEISRTVNGKKNVLESKQISAAARPGTAYHLDFFVTGNGTTSLKARAFEAAERTPGWQLATQDASSALASAKGNLRIGGYLSAGATKNSGLHVDNLVARTTSEPPAPTPELAPTPSPSAPPTTAPDTDETAPNSESINLGDQTPRAETLSAIPSTALYVSASGNDASGGTVAAPLRTMSKAISKAANGQTIVVRGGTYHESVVIPTGKSIKLREYPGETVWLDGSQAVTGFAATSNGWVKSGWNYDFDSSPTYTRGANDNTSEAWGFINSSYPMAAHPDQVWINGSKQTQVSSVSSLKPGTFYVDRTNDKLHLGTDPTGKTVRASMLVKALSIRSDNSTVSGINVRKYAPSVPDMGAVTAEKPGITVQNLTIEDSATTGLNVSAVKNTVSNVKIQRSGMLGMNAVYSDGLVVNKLTSTGNNHERFNTSPVSGGLKIGRTRGVTVKDSKLNSNYGPGLWLDESVYDSKVLNNDLISNTGHGLSLEISAKSVVANNRIAKNSGFAFKLNNTSDVKIWNNTISGKNRVLNIVQDARRGANKSDPGHDPRQPFPDTTMTWINKNIVAKNNVFSNTGGGNAILAVEDYSGSYTADQMKISLASNAYHRINTTNPKWSAVWSKAAGNPEVFTTLPTFRQSTGQELNSFEITANTVLTSANNPATSVTGKNSQATALPSDIASLIGQGPASKRIGNYPR